MAALDWWVLVPRLSEQNAAGTVADAFIVSTPQGSPADNTLLNTDSGRVTVGGRSGYRRAGPFTSEADAKAYLKVGAQNVSSPIPGVDITPGGGFTAAGPLSPLAAVASFLAKLGQASLWLRIGEVALGLVLVAVGVAKLVPAFTPAQMIAKRVGAAA